MERPHFIPRIIRKDSSKWEIITKLRLRGSPVYKIEYPVSESNVKVWDVTAFRPDMRDHLTPNRAYNAIIQVEVENSLCDGDVIMIPSIIQVYTKGGIMEFTNIR